MKSIRKQLFGLEAKRRIKAQRALPSFYRDLEILKRQRASSHERFELGRIHPCLDDKESDSGTMRGHYFHQDLFVAGKIHESNPSIHVDVGSRVDGFVAHVASFRPIEVFDIRPGLDRIGNIRFKQADLMKPLDEKLLEYCDSLSCLHALEHFGLGRYGDTIDYEGHLKGLSNLGKILKKSGKLYLSVPIGPQRIEYNAHRVFALGYLTDLLKGDYRLDSFAYVDDRGDLVENVTLTADLIERNCGCEYGCGIFELTRS